MIPRHQAAFLLHLRSAPAAPARDLLLAQVLGGSQDEQPDNRSPANPRGAIRRMGKGLADAGDWRKGSCTASHKAIRD